MADLEMFFPDRSLLNLPMTESSKATGWIAMVAILHS
jgi:hypothetical protein